jgi:hypothetical protein
MVKERGCRWLLILQQESTADPMTTQESVRHKCPQEDVIQVDLSAFFLFCKMAFSMLLSRIFSARRWKPAQAMARLWDMGYCH